MSDTSRPAPVPPTRAARLRWPLIVVAMLGCHVGGLLYAVKLALAPSASGVEGRTIDPAYLERDARGLSPERAPLEDAAARVERSAR